MSSDHADRLERIRSLLPDTWRLGAELEQPDPPAQDDEDDDDAVEMRGTGGTWRLEKSRRPLAKTGG
ncbi:MAG: hypothetical protein JJU22_03970 [Gammaproteobacteria bacterium]|nr:hypothetical protein [Gammaproteobacteria bacterium]